MAITITQGEATVAIRAATDPAAIPPAVATAVGFLFPAAVAIILEHAPNAPNAVHNAALIRLLGWLFDADPTDGRIARALQVSGAAPLLSRWRVHRAGAIQAAPALEPPPNETIPAPPPDGHYILTVNNGVLSWVAFPQP